MHENQQPNKLINQCPQKNNRTLWKALLIKFKISKVKAYKWHNQRRHIFKYPK